MINIKMKNVLKQYNLKKYMNDYKQHHKISDNMKNLKNKNKIYKSYV